MKKPILAASLLLLALALAACGQTDSAATPAETTTGAGDSVCGTESGVDMVNNTPVIWDSSNPDTAESLTYTDYGEAMFTYETADSAVIADCIAALRAMTVGAETDVRYADATAVLEFRFAEGGTYRVKLEHGNYVAGQKVYETKGFGAVSAVLDRIRDAADE